MLKIKILLIGDEPLYAGQLEMFVIELGHQIVGKADNANLALELVRQEQPDLVLIDINLKGKTDGIEVAARITAAAIIPIIFITSMQDDSILERAKSTLPHAFITKPFHAEKLQHSIELSINRAKETLQPTTDANQKTKDLQANHWDTFFIKTKNTLEKITLPEVLWIEVTNRDCNIYTLKKTIIIRSPLAELMTKLPSDNFIQVHRSYVVNTNHITSVNLTSNNITIQEKQIPVSKTFKGDILQKLRIL